MIKVYVVMETVGGRQIPRVVYKEKWRAKSWIEGACVMEDKDEDDFRIVEVNGMGF